jgi:hypothetical protein
MKEEFLHYLWKYGLYNKDALADTEGNRIIVIHPGTYNRDSGPDFFNSRILINGTLWAGNVEIHIRSSDFELHGHQNDPAYNNVILHVVGVNDRQVFNSRGEELLTAELHFEATIYDKYQMLVNNPSIIACQDYLCNIDHLIINQWITSLAVERLEKKTEAIMKIFCETGNDWEETFYRMLCRYFGFRVNSEPFEMLAGALPFKIIRKHADNLFQIEALLFGAAGMLDEGLFREALADEYYRLLIREYRILSAKYSLQSLHGWIWKFARLRPANFPTVRISQLATMLSVAGGLFSRVTGSTAVTELERLFEVPASAYWNDHFVFGKRSRESVKRTGSQATGILLINAVVPVIFVYGRERGRQDLCDRALDFLQNTEPEHNIIINEWETAGIRAESAFYTQALIQLRNEYCRKRRCLECRIGSSVVSMGKKLKDDEELILEP